MKRYVGTYDLLFVTLDSLRFDVARAALEGDELPVLGALLGEGGWEERHSPATFTLAAHQAFFAGFLPTPAAPGHHPRPFAMRFPGSTTATDETLILDASDIPTGLSRLGYRTICIGGVAFFDRRTPLGRVLPALFDESHWRPRFGPAHPRSTEYQVALAEARLASLAHGQRVFMFVNVSATHHPTHIFDPDAKGDTVESQRAALRYADAHLAPLFEAFRSRGPTRAIVCSDHGTAFGEDGYYGHRVAHPVVWSVPYAEFSL